MKVDAHGAGALILSDTFQGPKLTASHDRCGEPAVSFPAVQAAMGLDGVRQQWNHLVLPALTLVV
jgi:hypothetical protein